MLDAQLLSKTRENGRLDVVRLANELGLKVKPLKDLKALFSSAHAYITHKDNVFTIFVNQKQSVQRQRFSIAHEIGHFLKHKDEIIRKGKVDRESAHSLSKEQEQAADSVAAELLMPEADVRQIVEAKQLNGEGAVEKKGVELLAKRYDVSMFAMIVRLRDLGYYVPYVNMA